MKSLSRVIKANCFSLASPKLIDPRPQNASCYKIAKSKDTFDVADAQRIVAETEEVVQQILKEAQERAGEIVGAAHLEAEEILQDAQKKCAALQDTAREKGYQQGYQQGLLIGQDELAGEREKVREQFDRLKAEVKTEIKCVIQQLEPELIELAQIIARQILHTELMTSPAQVAAITKAAIAKANGSGEVVLKINSRDYDAITDLLVVDDALNESNIRIEVDNSLQGGCLIKTIFGTVDGTIDGQLQEVAHELKEVSCCD